MNTVNQASNGALRSRPTPEQPSERLARHERELQEMNSSHRYARSAYGLLDDDDVKGKEKWSNDMILTANRIRELEAIIEADHERIKKANGRDVANVNEQKFRNVVKALDALVREASDCEDYGLSFTKKESSMSLSAEAVDATLRRLGLPRDPDIVPRLRNTASTHMNMESSGKFGRRHTMLSDIELRTSGEASPKCVAMKYREYVLEQARRALQIDDQPPSEAA
jgi:hypothetical protein